MLTPEDIKNLTDYQLEVFKGVFTTKEDFKELKDSFSTLTSAVDAFAKRADTYYQEMTVLVHKVERMEQWIKVVSEKIGVSYNV
ncbi:MAG: hypothetical protein AAB729_01270 [Patescibacteria group bacterium]